MVDRTNAVRATGVRARLLKHAVAIGDEIHFIGIVPGDTALLQGIEPVIENLGVGPDGISGMCTLDRMLMQEGDCRLDEPHIRAEEQRKADRSRLPQRHLERRGRGLSQVFRHLCRLR